MLSLAMDDSVATVYLTLVMDDAVESGYTPDYCQVLQTSQSSADEHAVESVYLSRFLAVIYS